MFSLCNAVKDVTILWILPALWDFKFRYIICSTNSRTWLMMRPLVSTHLCSCGKSGPWIPKIKVQSGIPTNLGLNPWRLVQIRVCYLSDNGNYLSCHRTIIFNCMRLESRYTPSPMLLTFWIGIHVDPSWVMTFWICPTDLRANQFGPFFWIRTQIWLLPY